jgi:Transcriptional regulator PadR-like family
MTYIFGYSPATRLSTIVTCKRDKGRGCREGDVPNEKREKHGGEQPRPSGNNRVEVWPRNWLVPVILLSLRECTSYGYKLMEQTARYGFATMNPGTLYRTLMHMEKDVLCESERETNEAGPPRRVCVLDHGRRGGVPGVLGRGSGAVPAQHGRLLPSLHGQATSTDRPAERRRVEGVMPGFDKGVRYRT